MLARAMAKSMQLAVQNFDLENCSLVPVPSRRNSFAKRGFEPANILAKVISRIEAKTNNRFLPVEQLLYFSGAAADQASLSGGERRTNLIGMMSAKHQNLGRKENPRVILVDDIVTTGATLTESKRALAGIGVETLGFVTFAETLPKNRQNRHTKTI